jgi:hypothetical protein
MRSAKLPRLGSRRKLVLVDWLDSHSQAGGGWHPLDEVTENAKPVYCRSVGWLVSEDNGMKVLVPHMSGERNENVEVYGKGEIAIPKQAIIKLSVLRSE